MFKAKVFNEKMKNKLKIAMLLPATIRFQRRFNFSINNKLWRRKIIHVQSKIMIFLNKILVK